MQKKNAWNEVATELGIDVSEAQSRYNTIRTCFSRYLKSIREIRSGSGREHVQLKVEYEHLRWLIAYIKHRSTTSNLSMLRQVIVEAVADNESDVADQAEDRPMRTVSSHELNDFDDGCIET